MDTIEIRRVVNKIHGYICVMIDGQRKIETIDLFGTNEIPTGFTARANQSDVLKAIKRLNPDCNVVMA